MLNFSRTLILRSACVAETEAIGASFGALANRGDVVCLVGGIGVGKSCFARGFVRAAVGDAKRIVSSPTFMLVNEHRAAAAAAAASAKRQRQPPQLPPIDAYHLDLYRLATGDATADDESLESLDLPRLFAEGATVIEWAERLGTHAGEGPGRWREDNDGEGSGGDDAAIRGGRTLWIKIEDGLVEDDDDGDGSDDGQRLIEVRGSANADVAAADDDEAHAIAWASAAQKCTP